MVQRSVSRRDKPPYCQRSGKKPSFSGRNVDPLSSRASRLPIAFNSPSSLASRAALTSLASGKGLPSCRALFWTASLGRPSTTDARAGDTPFSISDKSWVIWWEVQLSLVTLVINLPRPNWGSVYSTNRLLSLEPSVRQATELSSFCRRAAMQLLKRFQPPVTSDGRACRPSLMLAVRAHRTKVVSLRKRDASDTGRAASLTSV